jgi:hypothetical protein
MRFSFSLNHLQMGFIQVLQSIHFLIFKHQIKLFFHHQNSTISITKLEYMKYNDLLKKFHNE